MDEGRQLGSSYTLDALLGEGASGHVWSGHDRDERPWAFKLLRAELAADPGIVQRFVQERTLLASIQHSNVVGVHDLVVEGGTLAIVMTLVDGTDLRGVIRSRGALPPAQVADWGAQLAAALQSAHRGGVVHRDVKPENVLVDSATGAALLTDFGIARLIDGAQRSTMMLGTPQYMAPEIAEGRDPQPAADLYSLGVVLYELCCGVPPFAGRGSAMATLRAHASDLPGRPDGIPDPLWAVIARLLAKDPAQRGASAGAVANDLAVLIEPLGDTPAAPTLTSPPPPAGAVAPPSTGEATHIAAGPAMLAGAGSSLRGAESATVFVNRNTGAAVAPMAMPPGASLPPGMSGQGMSGPPMLPWGAQPGYPYPTPGYGPPGGHPGYGYQPPRRSNRGAILGLAAAGLVLAGVGTAYYLSTRGDDGESTTAAAVAAAPASASPATSAPATVGETPAAQAGGEATAAPANRATAAPVPVFTPPAEGEPAPAEPAPSASEDSDARREHVDQVVRSYLNQAESGTITSSAMSTYFTPTIQWYGESSRISRETLYARLVKPKTKAPTVFDSPVFRSFTPGVSYGGMPADRISYDVGYTRPSGARGAVVVTYTLVRGSDGASRITQVSESKT